MSLRNAATVALIGMFFLTALLAADFIHSVVGAARDLIPMMAVLRTLIYLFAGVTVTVFFFVVSKEHSR
jgi:hypothetical protein